MAPDTLSLDELLDLTRNALRRELLFLLLERDRVSVTAAAASLGIADDSVRRLELSHIHLPKLAGSKVVEVNDDQVTRGPAFDEVAPLLQWLQSQQGADSLDDDS